jgi:putative peptidoglycan lipid II flippase
MTALLPPLSEYAVARDWAAFRATMARGIRLTAAVLLPAALRYLALAGPIVRLLLEHGVVTEASTSLLVPVLMAFVLGLVPFSTFQLVLRAFLADPAHPAYVRELDLHGRARLVAQGTGQRGLCIDYIRNTIDHMW